MAEKVTIMLLKVDLQCSRCYKKVKKVLCKFPQIRDQVYDEKNNIVIIKVFCCDPERIRDKLCAKGCGVIKSIEIRDPPLKTTQPNPTRLDPVPEPPDPEPEPEPEPDSESKPEPEPVDPPPEPPLKKNGSKNGTNGSKKNGAKDEQPPPPPPEPAPAEVLEVIVPVPVPVPEPEPEPEPEPTPAPALVVDPSPPPPPPVTEYPPRGYCCGQCYAGQHGGPCYYGYGGYGNGYGYGYSRPPPTLPPPAYDPYNYYGYNKGYCVTRCGECISDESATACTIM